MKRERENKKNYYVLIIFLLVFVAIVTIVYLNSGARYTSTGTDNTTQVEVGKWAVLVNTKDITENETLDGEITLKPIESSDVASGKFVPGSVAWADIEIDMSAAEVSGSYTIELDEDSLLSAGIEGFAVLGYQTDPGAGEPTTVPSGLAQEGEGIIEYSENSETMKETVRVFITWEPDEQYDISQTAAGIAAGTQTIPVTVTVEQVVPTYPQS